MPLPDLQNAIQREGFTIIDFRDARSYFGCWSLTVEGHAITYLIVNEGRDGWLMFYLGFLSGGFKRISWTDPGHYLVTDEQ